MERWEVGWGNVCVCGCEVEEEGRECVCVNVMDACVYMWRRREEEQRLHTA